MTAEDVAHVNGADADDDNWNNVGDCQDEDVVAVTGNVTSQFFLRSYKTISRGLNYIFRVSDKNFACLSIGN